MRVKAPLNGKDIEATNRDKQFALQKNWNISHIWELKQPLLASSSPVIFSMLWKTTKLTTAIDIYCHFQFCNCTSEWVNKVFCFSPRFCGMKRFICPTGFWTVNTRQIILSFLRPQDERTNKNNGRGEKKKSQLGSGVRSSQMRLVRWEQVCALSHMMLVFTQRRWS